MNNAKYFSNVKQQILKSEYFHLEIHIYVLIFNQFCHGICIIHVSGMVTRFCVAVCD